MSTPKTATSARDEVRQVTPTLLELTEKVPLTDRIAHTVLDGARS